MPMGVQWLLSFDVGGIRFNYRVGAVILEDDYALLNQAAGDDFWSSRPAGPRSGSPLRTRFLGAAGGTGGGGAGR